MTKIYIGDTDAQKSSYERAQEDKEKVKKYVSHEIRDKFGLSFNKGTLLIFFRSEEEMSRKRKRLEALHGVAKIIKPKFKKK